MHLSDREALELKRIGMRLIEIACRHDPNLIDIPVSVNTYKQKYDKEVIKAKSIVCKIEDVEDYAMSVVSIIKYNRNSKRVGVNSYIHYKAHRYG
jgi:hypothetical protein